tara:strand:+ start:125 stop:1687 length:1563 start_codon:yes stop_codon:yes gene_type:complete
MKSNNQKFTSTIKIIGVFLCLYLFLVGIKGLSGSIKHLTQPDIIEIGDMIQSKVKIKPDESFTDKGNKKYDVGEEFTDNKNKKWDEGEKFADADGNDKYDAGEKFTDAGNGDGVWNEGEGFIDSGNGKYDEGEEFIDTNNDGKWSESKKSKVWLLVKDKIPYEEDGKSKTKFKCEFGEDSDRKEFFVKEEKVKMVASSTFVSATSSAFIALFIGVFATVLFQSSSTTTSLIVGMVSTGVVGLSSGIAMIMGANIGTTVTNTIVSVGHIRRGGEFKRAFAASTVHDFFNIMVVIILFPIEVLFHPIEKMARFFGEIFFTELSEKPFESPIKAAVKWGNDYFKELSFGNDWALLITSIMLTFLMLYCIVKILRSLVLKNVEAFFDKHIFKTPIRAIIFGVLLTIAVQSSSITTSTIVPLAAAGVLSLRQVFPYTLGANIGTTATAIMAALTLNSYALVAAFSHLLFNIIGILVVYPFERLRNIPLFLAEKMSDLAAENKMVPIIYLLIVFFLIPFLIIMLGG